MEFFTRRPGLPCAAINIGQPGEIQLAALSVSFNVNSVLGCKLRDAVFRRALAVVSSAIIIP